MPLSQRYTFFLLYDFSIGARGFHGYAGNEIRFFEKIEVRDDRGAGNAGKAREFRVVKFRARVRREHLHERIDTLLVSKIRKRFDVDIDVGAHNVGKQVFFLLRRCGKRHFRKSAVCEVFLVVRLCPIVLCTVKRLLEFFQFAPRDSLKGKKFPEIERKEVKYLFPPRERFGEEIFEIVRA